MIGVGLPLRLILGLTLCGGAGNEKPLPPSIPTVLQVANTQASWEDRDIDFWVRAKVDGFLLGDTGISLPKEERPPTEDGLANLFDRLRRAGVLKNCLTVSLPTRQSPYVNDDAVLDFTSRAEKKISRAIDAGAWGVALDTRPSQSLHTFTWEGYGGENPPSRDSLRSNAKAVGVALGKTLAKDHHVETAFIITDGLAGAGPLWFSLIDGLLRGIGDASLPVHLIVCPSDRAQDLRSIRAETAKILSLKLSPEGLRVWERVGAVDFGLNLATLESPATESEEVRQRRKGALIAGKLNASEFVVNVEAPPVGWKSPDPQVDTLSFETPLDGFVRVGRHSWAGADADVLRNKDGAAAALLSGIPDHASIASQIDPIHVSNLLTGEVSKHPADTSPVELNATDSPTLVASLPIRTWAAPAGLWISAEYPPAGQTRTANINYGWANRTGVAMSGVIEATVPDRFAITPSGLPFSAADGDSVSAIGRITGTFDGAPTLTARLVLAAPQGEPIVHDFALTFPPPLRWSAEMDGPITAAPATADLDGDGLLEVYAASLSGDVASFNAAGELRWRWESPAPVSTSPVVFRHWTGTPHLAVWDDAGLLHCYKPDGIPRFEVPIGAPARNGHLLTANLHGFPGQELVCALDSGQILALLSNGQELWKFAAQNEIIGLTKAAGAEKRDVIVAALGDSTCIAIGPD
ncbi:MAG: hypothetical protein K1Y02_26895, partial [Candidatus Hydrogenedentes bacterium]|nr:hypothetical protein [Candidatus Hydrogenedentota bacterium]